MTGLPDMLIRDIVDLYPEAMPVLAGYGLDLCCGGGHSLADACAAHGLPMGTVVAAIEDALQPRLATSES